MGMMNISLPEKQINEIDSMIDRYGYANRSEFVRSVLRFVLKSGDRTSRMISFPFVIANPEDSPREVTEDFRSTGIYNAEFLKDLEMGLKKSKS